MSPAEEMTVAYYRRYLLWHESRRLTPRGLFLRLQSLGKWTQEWLAATPADLPPEPLPPEVL